MKKSLIIAAFIAALSITEKAQAQLNIHVGYSTETFSIKLATHDTVSIMFFQGINVGLGWEFDLPKNFSLSVGAQYRMNIRDVSISPKPNGPTSPYMSHSRYREKQHLIDLPILLKYNIHGGDKFTFSPFAGPMLSYGIKATSIPTGSTDLQYDWYDGNGVDYHPNRRFNLYAVAGVEFNFIKFSISLGGRCGFLNLSKNFNETIKAYSFFANFSHSF